MSLNNAKSKSINIEKSDNEDNDENDSEAILIAEQTLNNLDNWNQGGLKKNNLISQVISLTSKLVSSQVAESVNENGDTVISKSYSALPVSAKSALALKKYTFALIACLLTVL